MDVDQRVVDLLDGELYAAGPYETYAWLRAHAPLYWDTTNELWGASRYDDVLEIEKRKEDFVSSNRTKGGFRPNLPADDSLISLDDPLHRARRNLVSRRFSPRGLAAWEPEIRAKVTALLDAAEGQGGSVEAVGGLAAPLPAMMIGKLLGFPDEVWPDLQSWSERTIALGGGPRYRTEDGHLAVMEFMGAASALYDTRQGCPADDVMSVWTGAEVDGAPLGKAIALAECLLVLDGGAETTRTVIARMLVNLAHHPGEWEKLRAGADLVVAVEEFIRYVTPIHNMCRVATRDVELPGGVVPRGHQVVLMYGSANRDPAHFDEPERLDVTRNPNPHLSFGFGIHFCLGASLARLELKIFFEELVRRVRTLQITPGTAPVEMPNAFVYGLQSAHLDLEFGAP